MDWRRYLQASTSKALGWPGSGVTDILMVSPIPCCNKMPNAAALDTNHFVDPHASVSHKWRGQSVALLSFFVASITSCTSESFTDKMILSLDNQNSYAFSIERRQDWTILSIKTSLSESGCSFFAFSSILCCNNSLSNDHQLIPILMGLLYLTAIEEIVWNVHHDWIMFIRFLDWSYILLVLGPFLDIFPEGYVCWNENPR